MQEREKPNQSDPRVPCVWIWPSAAGAKHATAEPMGREISSLAVPLPIQGTLQVA